MPALTDDQIEKIKNHILQLIHADYALLFSAMVKTPHGESDIDLFLGSTIPYDLRLTLSQELEALLGMPVEVFFYHAAVPKLSLKAFARGRLLFRNNKDHFRCFYQYEDRKSLLPIRQAHIKMRCAHG